MKRLFHGQSTRASRPALLALLAFLYVLPLIWAAPAPAPKPVKHPAWWFQREVIKRVDPPTTEPTWPADYPAANDYAVATIGQLKKFATEAAAELNAELDGGSGSAINALIEAWAEEPGVGVIRNDYAAANLGQVKAVALPFYVRINAVRSANSLPSLPLPWTTATNDGDDYALANLGQLKKVFSFDLTVDADGDEVPDYLDPDKDGDGVSDAVEDLNGMSSSDPNDGLDDFDSDGIPNIYELTKATNPSLASSKPSPDFIVDPATGENSPTDTTYSTIQEALDAAPNSDTYIIISVKSGVYHEALIVSGLTHYLLIAEKSLTPTEIRNPSSDYDTIKIQSSRVLFDGFTISASGGTNTSAVYIDVPRRNDQVRFLNCIIRDHYESFAGGVTLNWGTVMLTHCTVFNNFNSDDGSVFYLSSNGTLILRNSIVWNPSNFGTPQIFNDGGSVHVTNSIVLGGEFGGIDINPLLDRYGGLYVGSPALNAAPVLVGAFSDAQGDARSTSPDIGADERVDTDADGLPDWWEQKYFSSSTSASSTGDDDVGGSDGLSNFYEYVFGTNPKVRDTDGDTVGDLRQSVLNTTDPWYPLAFRIDDDNDGLGLGLELLYGTNPADSDTNDDGLFDGPSIGAGISPTDSDPDGDSLTSTQERVLGTSPFNSDTDGDGVADNLDAFPLDFSRFFSPVDLPGAPIISLDEPSGATPL